MMPPSGPLIQFYNFGPFLETFSQDTLSNFPFPQVFVLRFKVQNSEFNFELASLSRKLLPLTELYQYMPTPLTKLGQASNQPINPLQKKSLLVLLSTSFSLRFIPV